mmetsp:Transcript_2143/g.4260  ORF Transcript_2143/g.4260 Transcript_2143/m.4260 type:complete len:203 (+) Transcript_2143:244-852(+)
MKKSKLIKIDKKAQKDTDEDRDRTSKVKQKEKEKEERDSIRELGSLKKAIRKSSEDSVKKSKKVKKERISNKSADSENEAEGEDDHYLEKPYRNPNRNRDRESSISNDEETPPTAENSHSKNNKNNKNKNNKNKIPLLKLDNIQLQLVENAKNNLSDPDGNLSQVSKTSSELNARIEKAIDDEINDNPKIVDQFSDLSEFKQ